MNAALNAARRAADLTELADGAPVDVVVIGGGITGTGVALDAAARGLRVVLVEKHDLAFGTSRWSSKLVHGGLRYLATGNVGIARRSAVERGILMSRNAPHHLVRAMPQLVPLLPSMRRANRTLVRTGFLAGDALRRLAGTSASTLPRSRRVDAGRAAELVPAVRRDGLDGGLLGLRRPARRRRAAGGRRRAHRGSARRTDPDLCRGVRRHRNFRPPDRPAHRGVVRRHGARRDQRDRRVGRQHRHVDQAAAQSRNASGVRRRGIRQSEQLR